MHADHDQYIEGLENRRKVILTFSSKEDGGANLVRTCAPMDFGPSSRAHDKSDRYHFWDYDSDTTRHTLSLLPIQVVSIELTDEEFDPAEFITWVPDWYHPRDWDGFS